MNDRALTRARGGDQEAFRQLTDPYRRQLQLHCYRMLGSVQDAEDLLQETLLAAWRGLEGFQGRASVSTWLYRIATNCCLNALRASARRPRELPTPADPPREPPEPSRLVEPIWLEPYPDFLLEEVPDTAAGPEARYETREALMLAFVASLQYLLPRERAVLILRDVLGFRAAEVAEMLCTTDASVTSALQRARSGVESRLPPSGRERAPLPRSQHERELVGRFADAFEADDVQGVVALLTDDALLTMPPEPLEYQGRTAIARFLSQVGALERVRLLPTRANGQPAFGCYAKHVDEPVAHAYALLVLTLEGSRVSAITAFPAAKSVFPYFNLPQIQRG